MVRVTSYSAFQEDEEATFHRYSSRGHEFALGHNREYPSASNHALYASPRNNHPTPQEPRTVGHSPESDSNSRPRSRIPVACGRCRKRKIRCSGDNGGPCTNCKNAGNEQCQFLRVSSEPAQMKNECAGYDYDTSGGAASRLNCRTSMIPSGPQSFGPHSAPLSLDGYPYRNNSLPPTYQYQVKPYYQIPSYCDFTDEGVDYGLQSQLMGADHLGIASNYITSSSARGWTPAPQLPKTPLFMEQSDTPFSHGQLPYHSFPSRTSIGSESKSISLTGLGASLPLPPVSASVDRMLPIPSANRPSQMGPLLRSADGLPSAPALQSQSYNDFNFRSIKNQNNDAVSENTSLSSPSYLPMSSTSPESLSSSQMAYGSQPSISMSQQQSDIYNTPPSNDGSGLCTNDLSDSSYGHASEGSKRGSHSSRTSNGDGSLPSMSGGLLANDREYRYVPTMGYPNQNYPMPPIHHPTPVSRTSVSIGPDHE